MRKLSGELKQQINQHVTVSGWVNSRRDHGGLIFIDLRDHEGIIQLVITPENAENFAIAESLRDEFVISATGLIRERDPALRNPHIATGDIELVVDALELLNRSEPLPVNTHDDGVESGEELRLKYRYLDLRRPSMLHTLRRRAEFYHFMRDYMEAHDFIEVTTPILANSSPEGARDFLVPSRLRPGQFYALPQAPQQFKQLLMVGGIPRYYQIAPCFRDEDPRADRLYGDFYQLDLEMSFVEEGEVVRKTMEPLIKSLVTDFAHKKLLSEEIPRIPYQEAIIYENNEVKSPIAKFLTETELAKIKELTGAENGDAVFFGADSLSKVNKVLGQLRIAFADHFNLKDDNVVALCWIVDFPFYEWDEGKNKLDFGHNPFSMPKGGLKALEAAETDAEKLAIVADQYDMVMNGFEICSGAVRNHSPEVMYKVFGILGYDEKYVEARFGGMLNAFKFGAPPHAGCAFGIERIFMVLNDNKNIRDIVAFPKNGSGVDLMMSSPSVVDPIQLEEAHLQIVEDEE